VFGEVKRGGGLCFRVKSPFRMVLDAGYLGTKGTGLATGRRQSTAVAAGMVRLSAPNWQDAERPLAATGNAENYRPIRWIIKRLR